MGRFSAQRGLTGLEPFWGIPGTVGGAVAGNAGAWGRAIGERVICLRNNRKENIYNGMLGTIEGIEPQHDDWYRSQIRLDGERYAFEGTISRHQFGLPTTLRTEEDLARLGIDEVAVKDLGDLFDWGYALTVHKAQGGEAKNVIVFEEKLPKYDRDTWQRWLYTAVTRSSERLLIVGSQ